MGEVVNDQVIFRVHLSKRSQSVGLIGEITLVAARKLTSSRQIQNSAVSIFSMITLLLSESDKAVSRICTRVNDYSKVEEPEKHSNLSPDVAVLRGHNPESWAVRPRITYWKVHPS